MTRQINEAGYTLIEVLISVAIFSALSLIAYSALNTLARSSEASGAHAESLADVQMMLYRLESDVRSLVIRPRWGDNNSAGDFFGEETVFGGVRSGWDNPLNQPRANLQRFQYRWIDQQLERWYAPTLSATMEAGVERELISDELTEFRLRYLDRAGQWRSQWRASAGEPLPRAIEVVVDHPKFGVIRRWMVIR